MNDVLCKTSSPLEIDVGWDGVLVATVTVTGDLDCTTAPMLTMRLQAVATEHPDGLVLDLGGLVFADAAGARALDRAYTLLQAECPVLVRPPRPSARRAFEVIGLMKDMTAKP